MEITRLNHVQISIPVGSEGEVRRFYCGLMGLRETPKPDPLVNRGGLWVEIGDLQIHFGVEDVDRVNTKRHVAFEVRDLAKTRQEFEQSGIKIAESIPIDTYDRFNIRDPFGNRLEFMQRREK